MKILETDESLSTFSVIATSTQVVLSHIMKEEALKGEALNHEKMKGVVVEDEVLDSNIANFGDVDTRMMFLEDFEAEVSEASFLSLNGEGTSCTREQISDLEGGQVSEKGSVPGLMEPDAEGSFYEKSEAEIGALERKEVSKNVTIPGLRTEPDPFLIKAGNCEERPSSESNDRWALKRADSLRSLLKWNMSVPLGDVPLEDLNELLANLFSRAVKVDGSPYPSATLMNMMNCFNRIIRRANDRRAVQRLGNEVPRDFNITKHPVFAKTRMVLRAAIRKSAKEGVNKKRAKVEVLTEEHEKVVLADIDHQLTSSQGCQKRLAFYCLVRLGIRGGLELWELQREDLTIVIDKAGKEYVRFEERVSKNNNYELERYNEEQFRKTYHSYEDDFVLCVKQYLRHMAPVSECEKADLFMGAIPSPIGNVWYNKSQKVGRDKAGGWLRNMLILVGLPGTLFSNRSGRASLVTRLAVLGVPDEVGMMVTGHHSVSGYQRYDRTQDLKMQAAVLVSANPGLTYETALTDISQKFVAEKVVGSSENLKPLVRKMVEGLPVALVKKESQVEKLGKLCPEMEVRHPPETPANRYSYEALHKDYDEIDWECEFAKSPFLARVLGGNRARQGSIGSNITGSSFQNCNITIKVVQPSEGNKAEEEIENTPPV